MKVNISFENDKEFRDEIHRMIVGEVKNIIRNELESIVDTETKRMIKKIKNDNSAWHSEIDNLVKTAIEHSFTYWRWPDCKEIGIAIHNIIKNEIGEYLKENRISYDLKVSVKE